VQSPGHRGELDVKKDYKSFTSPVMHKEGYVERIKPNRIYIHDEINHVRHWNGMQRGTGGRVEHKEAGLKL
jgi:hypothetical protein